MKSFLLALATVLLAACGSPIVGAECRDGFTNCAGQCVDLTRDPDHCGACEDSCGAFSCEDSECTDEPRPDGGDGDGDGDGGDLDGGGGTGGRRDSGITPIGTGNPFLPDGGLMFPDPMVDNSCPIGTIRCGDLCVNPNADHGHCGGCDMECAGDEFCALGMCVQFCPDPLELCVNACVDFQKDPLNCGRCGNQCASGICVDGECADAVAGHVIVIGHDYRTSNVNMRRLAYNALSQAAGSPRRTLFYRGDASAQSIAGTINAINSAAVAGASGSWIEIDVEADELTSSLLSADALMIPAQDDATDARLIELGQQWGLALTQFVARGGVIVLFETQTSANAGTFQILGPSGLFSAESRSAITSGRLQVKTPISLGLRLAPSYAVSRTTVAFENVTSTGDVIVTTPDDRPVVVHRVVSP